MYKEEMKEKLIGFMPIDIGELINVDTGTFVRYINKKGELKGATIHKKQLEFYQIELELKIGKTNARWPVDVRENKFFRRISLLDKYFFALRLLYK